MKLEVGTKFFIYLNYSEHEYDPSQRSLLGQLGGGGGGGQRQGLCQREPILGISVDLSQERNVPQVASVLSLSLLILIASSGEQGGLPEGDPE